MQPSAAALVAVLALPFGAAALTPLAYRVLGERVAYFAAAVAAACLALLASQYDAAMAADPASSAVVLPWVPSLDVSLALYLDGLALLVGVLASGVGVLVFVYSRGYMHGEAGQAKYYATMLAFMGSMLGVALAADLVALFVFWELTSVTSFLLIGHHSRSGASRYAARKAMLVTVVGGLFMLVGFLLLAAVAGDGRSFALIGTADSLVASAPMVREALRSAGVFIPVLSLVAVGAAAKSAQVPLHVWLPDAMEAPTPVSAFLHSATMVKAGVYLVGRFRPLLLADVGVAEWTMAFATLGLVTMLVTAMLAVGARDIKELLAYSTASHLGLIVAGFGLANVYGAEAGAFHILNHASFKAALFLVAGIVAHEAGTRDVRELSGLRHDLPVTAAITAVAALSMAGVPPLNGFYSKELLFEATWEFAVHEGGVVWLFPAVAVLASVFTFLYSMRFLWLFLGDRPEGLSVHRPPTAMLAPAAVLALLALAISVVPQAAVDVLVDAAFRSTVADPTHHMHVGLPTALSPYLGMSALALGLGAAAFPFYDRLHRWIRRARAVGVTSPDRYYDVATARLDPLGRRVADGVHTGLLHRYVAWTLGSVGVLTLSAYVAGGIRPGDLPAFAGLQVSVPLALVLAVAVVAAAAVGRAPSHVAGVLTLSILGFMVAIFYILGNAPDLALTQLVVETLVLVIFLLVLDKLPAFYGEARRLRTVFDAGVAAVVGLTVFVTVLLSTAATPDDPIYRYFLRTGGVPADHGPIVVDAGGGHNIVNVILVDFRAFDTLGEISVVAMAGLSVLTLVAMRGRGEA